ncbi:hypothetical protein INR49_011177 [Caranx melampygus]|nr:hypothetical protein INR49_011177 [Caranx melampygus]
MASVTAAASQLQEVEQWSDLEYVLALYMAKPSTANTVAPTLALSQKPFNFQTLHNRSGHKNQNH